MDNKEIQASYQKNFKSSISIEYIQSDKVDYIYFNVYVSKCKLHLWHTNNPVDNVVLVFSKDHLFFLQCILRGINFNTLRTLFKKRLKVLSK